MKKSDDEDEGCSQGSVNGNGIDVSKLKLPEGYDPQFARDHVLAAERMGKEHKEFLERAGSVGDAARWAAEINPTLAEFSARQAGIENFRRLQAETASSIQNMESIRDFSRKRTEDRLTFTDPSQFINLNQRRDERLEEFQDELIAVLKRQEAQTLQLRESQNSSAESQKELLEIQKKGRTSNLIMMLSAIVAAISAVITLVFTVMPIFSSSVPSDNSTPTVESVGAIDESKNSLEGPIPSEEQAQPQPAPTPADVPADSAPSSSDQREP